MPWDEAGKPGLRLVYLVHDFGDPAVARRLAMLRPSLASAVVIGFHRAATAPAEVGGWPAIALGRTRDGRLARRAASVLRALARMGPLREPCRGATVILARQLEMLALAWAARNRFSPASVLAYECLDIHRLMVVRSAAGVMLRGVERPLLRAADLLVVSSPAFLEAHFRPAYGAALPPTCLIENKVLESEIAPTVAESAGLPAGPPWRIGWYGVLRCRRSLELLAELTRRLPGRVMVELRGRPARSAIPDFDALVAASPGLRFLGEYDRGRDLPEIYRRVHFTWAVDYYESGANSRWLLPNRLYEGGLHGAVPIALAAVETGQWLARHGAGVLLGEDAAEDLLRYFSALQPASHEAAARALAALPRSCWVDEGEDGARLAAALRRRRRSEAVPVAPFVTAGHGAAMDA